MVKPLALVKHDTWRYVGKGRSGSYLKVEATVLTYLLCLHTRRMWLTAARYAMDKIS